MSEFSAKPPRHKRHARHGEGSVKRRKSDGLWIGRIMADGKVYMVSSRDEATCKAKLEKKRDQIKKGSLPDADVEHLTIGDYLESWHETKRGELRPRTWIGYGRIIKQHLVPTLGKIELLKLTRARVRRLTTDKLAAGLAPATVGQIQAVLRSALSMAVEDKALTENVARIKPPRIERDDRVIPSAEAIGRFVDAALEANDRLAPLWTVAAYSGCRQGEILGLKWSDVDLDAGTVEIRRSLHAIGKNHEPDLRDVKTKRSRRTVTLPTDAIDALRRQRVLQAEERLAVGADYGPWDLVFATEIGTPIQPNALRYQYKLALARAGLSSMFRFHDLRHFAATLMLRAGVHPKVASARLGHSNVHITLDLYTHAVKELDEDAAARMQEAMNRARRGSFA